MSFPLLDVTLPAPSVWDILAGCLDNLPLIFSTAGASHAGDDAFSGWPASPAPFSIIHLPDEESDTHFPHYCIHGFSSFSFLPHCPGSS